MEWISVKDRLPEQYEDVLIYFERSGCMAVAYLSCPYASTDSPELWKCAFGDDCDGNDCYVDCITTPSHWMPLPESPKD